jgi:hypothetical protein
MYDKSMVTGIECEQDNQSEWDKAEALALQANIRKGAYVKSDSKKNNTLYRVMKELKLPHEHHDIYRHWLLNHQPEHSSWCPEMVPEGRKDKLQPGLVFPFPSGHNWLTAVEHVTDKRLGITHDAMLARVCITEAYKFCKNDEEENTLL